MQPKTFADVVDFNKHNPTDSWPRPDMAVLTGGRREAPEMPREMFGDVWPLLSDLAEGAGSPIDYVAVGFTVTAASLIGGKRRVRPFKSAPWSEPCILWATMCGDPSSGKSPAIDAITAPLRAMELDHKDLHDAALLDWQAVIERAKCEAAAWSEQVKAAQKDGLSTPAKPISAIEPEPPIRRRLMVTDATPEAMAAILSGNPQGTLHLRDELAGWLLSFDRYSQGGRPFWLEAYGGRPYVVDRKGSQKALTVPFNGISILGGVQPERLAECLLNTSDDGLVARFLWCWPTSSEFVRPRQLADMAQLETIYRRLEGLGWARDDKERECAVTLTLDDAAADLFEEWIKENRRGIEDAGAFYKGFCGKLPGTVLRLALVAELVAWACRGGIEPGSISALTLASAIEFCEQYAKPSAKRVFGDASLPVAERNASILARYILRKDLRRVNARSLKRSPHKSELPSMRQADALNDALSILCDADWLRDIGSRDGSTAGRRAADYIVNPQVFEVANG